MRLVLLSFVGLGLVSFAMLRAGIDRAGRRAAIPLLPRPARSHD